MGLEKSVNQYGQNQKINSFDKIIKIGNRFLQIRLIKTKKYRGKGWTKEMPRARFVNPIEEGFAYVVDRDKLLKIKGKDANSEETV